MTNSITIIVTNLHLLRVLNSNVGVTAGGSSEGEQVTREHMSVKQRHLCPKTLELQPESSYYTHQLNINTWNINI